jgi:HK97 family phage major capsid protein
MTQREKNDAQQKLDRLSVQMNAIVARCKKENNRGLTSDERTKFHLMEEEYTEIEDAIRLNGDDTGSRPRLPAGALSTGVVSEFDVEEVRDTYRLTESQRRERNRPENRAFMNYIRNGLDGMDPEERALVMARKFNAASLGIKNTMSTTTGSQGEYVVPTGFADALMEALLWFGGVSDGNVGILNTPTGNTMPYPTINDTYNRGRVMGENVQTVETDFVFGTVSFSAYILCSDLVLIPLALLQDSYFDLESWSAHLLGVRIGRQLNYVGTVGSGTNQPTGIVTAAVAAGNVFQLGTGNTATIGYSNLVDVMHLVNPNHREKPSSKWMFSDTMLKLIKKLVDGNNRPLWQPGLTSSFQDGATVIGPGKPQILGAEYVINDDMAVPSSDAYTALFGDMSTFKVRKIGEPTILVLSERYADYLQKGILGFLRVDSNLVDAGTHPIAVLQQSAS